MLENVLVVLNEKIGNLTKENKRLQERVCDKDETYSKLIDDYKQENEELKEKIEKLNEKLLLEEQC